jgi:hypothetical protein
MGKRPWQHRYERIKYQIQSCRNQSLKAFQ